MKRAAPLQPYKIPNQPHSSWSTIIGDVLYDVFVADVHGVMEEGATEPILDQEIGTFLVNLDQLGTSWKRKTRTAFKNGKRFNTFSKLSDFTVSKSKVMISETQGKCFWKGLWNIKSNVERKRMYLDCCHSKHLSCESTKQSHINIHNVNKLRNVVDLAYDPRKQKWWNIACYITFGHLLNPLLKRLNDSY